MFLQIHSDARTISFGRIIHLTYVKRTIHSNEMVAGSECIGSFIRMKCWKLSEVIFVIWEGRIRRNSGLLYPLIYKACGISKHPGPLSRYKGL